jgi:hypothetical protein
MNAMMLARILLLFFVAGLVYICWLQGDTISQQRNIIRTMTQNPQCIVPEGDR